MNDFMLTRLGTQLAIGLLEFPAILPYGLVARFGDDLGWLLYQIPSRRDRVVRTNLRLCFPQWHAARRNEVAGLHFRHRFRSHVELSIQWFGSEEKLAKLVWIDSEIDLLGPDMPSTLLLGAHFFGVEAGSIFINYALRRQCGALYHPISNPLPDKVAIEARGRFGSYMASRADSARIVLRWLRGRKPAMLCADMGYGKRNSIFVSFFGIPASTLTATGRLARARNARMVPFISEVLPGYRGYYLKGFKHRFGTLNNSLSLSIKMRERCLTEWSWPSAHGDNS